MRASGGAPLPVWLWKGASMRTYPPSGFSQGGRPARCPFRVAVRERGRGERVGIRKELVWTLSTGTKIQIWEEWRRKKIKGAW